MNPYHSFVSEFVRLRTEGKRLPLGGFGQAPRPDIPAGAPVALIFSPHPDDECIVGGLPLRLFREEKLRVINVAVTQGSNKSRQAQRWVELEAACDFLGFETIQTKPGGLEGISAKKCQEQAEPWRAAVGIIAGILRQLNPAIIFFPHARDWNSTHIGTHCLVREALEQLGGDFGCDTVETEFWGPMDDPNLMVESNSVDVADLVGATSFHAGEVQRNPYHLILPAWMQDNVRRGGELVGGQGGAAPDFVFATLYRLRRWEKGGFVSVPPAGRSVSASERVSALFRSLAS